MNQDVRFKLKEEENKPEKQLDFRNLLGLSEWVDKKKEDLTSKNEINYHDVLDNIYRSNINVGILFENDNDEKIIKGRNP